MREDLMREGHTEITGGHLEFKKTADQIQRRAYWFEWKTDVEYFCKCCDPCSRFRQGKPPKQTKLCPTNVGEFGQVVAIDLTGRHPISRSGNVYILTVIDLFTKNAEMIPIRNKEAITVARVLFDVIFSKWGFPQRVLSDCG